MAKNAVPTKKPMTDTIALAMAGSDACSMDVSIATPTAKNNTLAATPLTIVSAVTHSRLSAGPCKHGAQPRQARLGPQQIRVAL